MSKTKNKEPVKFTGIARSVECRENQGFNNFVVVKLTIKDGVVIERTESDAYASFEAIARHELTSEQAILNLNNNWEDGKALQQ